MKKLYLPGTFILKSKGVFYKVMSVKPCGHNEYSFDCRDTRSKKPEHLKFRILGLLDAMDTASKHMADPKDIFLLDLDDGGIWKVVPGGYIEKLEKDFKMG